MLKKIPWLALLVFGFCAFTGIAQVPSSKEAQARPLGVRMKDGRIVSGTISGTLIQKDETESKDTQKHSGKLVFTKGEYVESIDEEGVHTKAREYSFVASASSATAFDVVAIFQKYLYDDGGVRDSHKGTAIDTDASGVGNLTVEANINNGQGPYGGPKNQNTRILGLDSWIDSMLQSAPSCPIVGTYLKDKDTGKYKFIPVLEVTTDKGIVTIPVGDIVEFKTPSSTGKNPLTDLKCKPNLDKVRFDGLYRMQVESYTIYQYLRFFEDGTVREVYSREAPEEVAKWFVRTYVSSVTGEGRYTTSGCIHFSLKSDSGVVEYKGDVEMNALKVNAYSHINGHSDSKEFGFVKVELH